MDELASITAMHKEQRRWRFTCKMSFIAMIIVVSVILIVFPRQISGIFVQILMILSMISVGSLVFLDRISYQINKKFFKKDVTQEYLFKHSIPEDIYKDPDIVVELIKNRRSAALAEKRL